MWYTQLPSLGIGQPGHIDSMDNHAPLQAESSVFFFCGIATSTVSSLGLAWISQL